jgi:hypothetical protein
MDTDITRQVSASVYENTTLREKLYLFMKNPYKSVVESYGIDTNEVLKHVCNARENERTYYFGLFLPSLIFWLLVFMTSGTGEGRGVASTEMTVFKVVLLLVVVVLVFSHAIDRRRFIKENLTRNSYTSEFAYKGDTTLMKSFNQREGKNIIFYSGYTPFVGSGLDQGGWSFVVDLDKGKREVGLPLTPRPFNEDELYHEISSGVNNLQITNLTVSDKVFINGKSIRENRLLLPNILAHPINEVSGEYLKVLSKNDSKDARLYKLIQVVDWEGDLVFSNFFRVKVDNKTLFVESNYYLLPPITTSFKNVDNAKQFTGIRYKILWFFTQLGLAFLHSFTSVFVVLSYIAEGIQNLFVDENASLRKEVAISPDFDYGASTSIREAIAQTFYTQHFQKLDVERYSKIIEKKLFNLIGDFLDSHNIDTSEFREREANILNNGVIVTGGQLSSQNLAVGKGSKVQTKKQTVSNVK